MNVLSDSAAVHSYFNDNQYPDEAKREEIANACNSVIQKPGTRRRRDCGEDVVSLCNRFLATPCYI